MLPDIECSQQPVPWEMLCKSWWVIAAHSAKPSHENWDIKVWYAKEAILTLSPAHGCYYRCPAAGLRRKLHHLTGDPCSVASSLTFPRAVSRVPLTWFSNLPSYFTKSDSTTTAVNKTCRGIWWQSGQLCASGHLAFQSCGNPWDTQGLHSERRAGGHAVRTKEPGRWLRV